MNTNSSASRWAVAGVGALASIGRNAGELFDALNERTSGLAPLRRFDATRFRAHSAYEIEEAPPRGDRPGRASELVCQAVAEAVADAGIGENLADVPVLVGTGLRELRSAELWWTDNVPMSPGQLHFGPALRRRFGAATTYTISNACSASLYALGMATDLLETGAADTVVVAGVDVITQSMFGLLDRVHPEPVDAVRPFDRNRRGVLMGDGAAAVVLRRPDQLGATRPKCWLRGVGLGCDAYHVTAPDPVGVAATMREAHEIAGVKPSEVDLVLAHGTGTLLNDEAEAAALSTYFGGLDAEASPLVTAVKSMTGHTSGASGLMSLVVASLCLATGLVPPTLGLADPVDEAADLRFVTGQPARADLRLAQVDAFGFGGVNAVAVVERVA